MYYYPLKPLSNRHSPIALTKMNNAVYQTPDSKKEEYRKYLEKSGVVDALTKVLVGLYEESDKPDDAIEYLKKYLGAPTGIDVDALRSENEELKKQNTELLKTIEELNKRLTVEEEEEQEES